MRLLRPSPPRSVSLLFLLASLGGACGSDPAPHREPEPEATDPGTPRIGSYWFRTVAAGLDRPVEVAFLVDGSGRYLVADQDGALTFFADDNERIGEARLAGVQQGEAQQGVLGIALDPEAEDPGAFLYVVATTEVDLETSLLRYPLTVGEDAIEVGAPETLLVVSKPAAAAGGNGGGLAFGDGVLFVGIGDGGAPAADGDLLGTVLRVTVDADGAVHGASGNPGGGLVYGEGFQSPSRIVAFNHTVWVADDRDDRQELVQMNVPGAGTSLAQSYDRGDEGHGRDDLDYAGGVAERALRVGCVQDAAETDDPYEGTLHQNLLYTDGEQGWVRALALATDGAGTDLHLAHAPGISAMALAPGGYVLAVRRDLGHVVRLELSRGLSEIAPVGQPLSEQGVFEDVAADPLVPVAGVLAYDVAWPLYADGHSKERYLVLPEGTSIDAADEAAWLFSVGTRFFKTFTVTETAGGETRERKVETRIIEKTDAGWIAGTYLWNFDETEAFLSDGTTRTIRVQVTDAPPEREDYALPGVADCARCHSPNGEWVLGFSHFQLGDEQVESFGDLWTPTLGAAPVLGGTPEQIAARGFLHGNCSHCHHPGGVLGVDIDFRFATPEAEMGVIGELSRHLFPGATLVIPGNAEDSVLPRAVADVRMPPLAVTTVNEEGAEALRAWIDAME